MIASFWSVQWLYWIPPDCIKWVHTSGVSRGAAILCSYDLRDNCLLSYLLKTHCISSCFLSREVVAPACNVHCLHGSFAQSYEVRDLPAPTWRQASTNSRLNLACPRLVSWPLRTGRLSPTHILTVVSTCIGSGIANPPNHHSMCTKPLTGVGVSHSIDTYLVPRLADTANTQGHTDPTCSAVV